MADFEFEKVSKAGLAADADYTDGLITLRLEGIAEVAAQEPLNEILGGVHIQARQLGIKDMVVDVRALSFMNSCCFKSFVTWLSDVQGLPKPEQYGIRFLTNPKIRWQRASLHALSCFAVDLVRIDAEA